VFLMPLFHPAAALRTPSLVETLREDFAKLPELIARPLPEPAGASPSAAEFAVEVPPAGAAEGRSDQLDLFG
jgi:DNA polymerase